MRLVLDRTKNGEELVEFALDVMREKLNIMRDRIECHHWLADRGLGKAVEQHVSPELVRAELAVIFGKLREKLSPEVYRLILDEVASDPEAEAKVLPERAEAQSNGKADP